MTSPRMRRVNSLLHQVIADEVPRLKDPRVGFVTITGVSTSPDLRSATVYYSTLGSEEEQEATAAALRSAAPHLQAELGRQVRLRYLPRLSFERDEAVERGLRVQEILQEIDGEERDDPSGGDPESG